MMTYASSCAIVQAPGVDLAGAPEADSAGAAVLPLPPRILNMTVPHVGHLPLMAFRPFFIVSSTASMISFLALHLTQYPSGIRKICCRTLHCASAVTINSLLALP